MTVTPIDNRSIVLDTWTAQSTKEIERLTNAGGATNHVSAMGEVIKLQCGAIGDTAGFSWQAVKSISSLDMVMLVQSVKLAIKHAIQAGITFPGLVVPHLVVKTTGILGIKNELAKNNWQAQAKALATQVCERGSEYAQKGVDLAKKVQAKPQAMLAVKAGAGLAALGLGGLTVNRYVGGSAPLLVPPGVPGYGTTVTLFGIACGGIAYALVWGCVNVYKRDTDKICQPSINDLLGAIDQSVKTRDDGTFYITTVNVEGSNKTLVNGRGHIGYLEDEGRFVKGRIRNGNFIVKAPGQPEQMLQVGETNLANSKVALEIKVSLAKCVFNRASALVITVIQAKKALSAYDQEKNRQACIDALEKARSLPNFVQGCTVLGAEQVVTDHDRNREQQLQAVKNAPRMEGFVDGCTIEQAEKAVKTHDREQREKALNDAQKLPGYVGGLTVEQAQRALDYHSLHRNKALAAIDWARRMDGYKPDTTVEQAQQAVDNHARAQVDNAEDRPPQGYNDHTVRQIENNLARLNKEEEAIKAAIAKNEPDAQDKLPKLYAYRQKLQSSLKAAQAYEDAVANRAQFFEEHRRMMRTLEAAHFYKQAQDALNEINLEYEKLVLNLEAAQAYKDAQDALIQFEQDHARLVDTLRVALAYEPAQANLDKFNSDHGHLERTLVAARAYEAARQNLEVFDTNPDRVELVNVLNNAIAENQKAWNDREAAREALNRFRTELESLQ